MSDNILTAVVRRNHLVTLDHRWQYDYGQKLRFEGIELPEVFEGHFANSLEGETITQVGTDNTVPIPDSLFLTGQTIFAWVFVHDGETDGRTKYMVKIPVWVRPQMQDDTPTPEEQSAVTQAIAALNVAVNRCEEAVEHYPKVENGHWFIWDGEWIDTGIAAQGVPGEKGDRGDDGYSPTVEVTRIENGYSISITDTAGVHTYTVYDGVDATEAAKGYAEEAENWAHEAEMSASAAGYMDVEIVNGRLIYTRTDAVDVDFRLKNGHLIMEAV